MIFVKNHSYCGLARARRARDVRGSFFTFFIFFSRLLKTLSNSLFAAFLTFREKNHPAAVIFRQRNSYTLDLKNDFSGSGRIRLRLRSFWHNPILDSTAKGVLCDA